MGKATTLVIIAVIVVGVCEGPSRIGSTTHETAVLEVDASDDLALEEMVDGVPQHHSSMHRHGIELTLD